MAHKISNGGDRRTTKWETTMTILLTITDDEIAAQGGGFEGAIKAIDRQLGRLFVDLSDVSRYAIATMMWLEKKITAFDRYDFTQAQYDAARRFLIDNISAHSR